MLNFFFSVLLQTLTFAPLALAISISYFLLRATDMTIDGTFVLGAAVFARLATQGCPPVLALLAALLAGAAGGALAASIQRGGRVDSLLAGVLATFILSSLNLVIMNRPNISLLNTVTLVSHAFASSEWLGWLVMSGYVCLIFSAAILLLSRPFGLTLRALGDNANLLRRLGINIEYYRLAGFALTNSLAAAAGALTAQTVGYADIGMGFGMTLTGIGAVILGQHLLHYVVKRQVFRLGKELMSAALGVLLYFLALNFLLRIGVDPIYLKMILGLVLIFFLRTAMRPSLLRTRQ